MRGKAFECVCRRVQALPDAYMRLLARQGARRCKKALVRRRSMAFVGARRRSKALDSARQRSTVEGACFNALDGARRRS